MKTIILNTALILLFALTANAQITLNPPVDTSNLNYSQISLGLQNNRPFKVKIGVDVIRSEEHNGVIVPVFATYDFLESDFSVNSNNLFSRATTNNSEAKIYLYKTRNPNAHTINDNFDPENLKLSLNGDSSITLDNVHIIQKPSSILITGDYSTNDMDMSVSIRIAKGRGIVLE